MSTIGFAKLQELKAGGYWAKRLITQLEYAQELSRVDKGQYEALINEVKQVIARAMDSAGAITKDTALKAEELLCSLAERGQAYTLFCVAHAHIDMNWMWRWDETVGITLETFRTMLKLLDEYPKFTFAQSQASTYQVVERYAPEFLPEIKRRIKEGRWEVTASTWVEGDKNLPNGESLVRQILYTKAYLSKLLDINPDSLLLDFEPDTFGHSANVPEILAGGGVEYYYHCRGALGPFIYNWVAPSGQSVLTYREPDWYDSGIDPKMILYVPRFCQDYGISSMLKVYGVGDHGGGPTRRDIETILDMQKWSLTPTIKFGTYLEFYQALEKHRDQFEVVQAERNCIFTGCYTSQARIKEANRVGEKTLKEAELFGAWTASLNKEPTDVAAYAQAWTNILFNQFHDILPGSCTVDTREHALGIFQESLAIAASSLQRSYREITSRINTVHLVPEQDLTLTTAEGAGVGFGWQDFKFMQSSVGAGRTRLFTIFNPCTEARLENVEIILWDWPGETRALVAKDSQGQIVPHQILSAGQNRYWDHHYIRLLLEVSVPALGYATYLVAEDPEWKEAKIFPIRARFDLPPEYVLENELVRAAFDPVSLALVSLQDKSSGEELIAEESRGGVFRLINEDDREAMTSWRVGRYQAVQDLVENVRILVLPKAEQNLRQSLSYALDFAQSSLEVTVSLDAQATYLDYQVCCNWREIGKNGYLPQLNFSLPVNYQCREFCYDVPFGVVTRAEIDGDVPANSWALALAPEGRTQQLMLTTAAKNGFRGVNNTLAVSLIRGSYDPDPYPEVGEHKFCFAVGIASKESSKQELINQAIRYNHPLVAVSTGSQEGDLPLKDSFFTVLAGSVCLSAVKGTEDGVPNKLIVRLYETAGEETEIKLQFNSKIKDAWLVDLNERPLVDGSVKVKATQLVTNAQPFQVINICMELV